MEKPYRGWGIRLALTAALLSLAGFAGAIWAPLSSNASARLAGGQLDGTNAGAARAWASAWALGWLGSAAGLAVLALLAWIWAPYLYRVYRAAALMLLAAALAASPARAYWSTQDLAEPIGVGSDVTAFWVPTTGDTSAQSSNIQKNAALFAANQVPGGVFFVPHAKVSNSAGWASWDDYAPTGRLYLVNRDPYNREWTRDGGTGTGKGDQSFYCQSKDSMNINVGVSLGVEIRPEDAALYLATFGTDPIPPDAGDAYMQANAQTDPQGLNDPETIFASAVHARSLTEIMDGVGHSLIGVAVCDALGANTLVQDNAQYVNMMAQIQQQAQAYLAPRGVTLDFIGWSSGLNLDPDVQLALNNSVVAQIVGPYIPVLKDQAIIGAIQKWDEHLPNQVTLVGLGSDLLSLVGGAARPTK